MKRESTEDALLRAAREVFAEKGFFNAKITDITTAAGRSAGSFYTYYENKTQILDALLDDFTRQVTQASLANRSEDAYQDIAGIVGAFWTAFREHRGEMIGLFGLKMTDASYAERWRGVRALGIEGIAARLAAAQRAGHLRDADAQVVASALLSMMESFAWTWIADGGDQGVPPLDDEAAIATVSNLWYRMVYGPLSGEPTPR
ncbi:TetR/AcrR family transcriptional regulator [Nocardioides sp. Bht2]|uniref:TetR/AcrR family transcriptional regulator n=1 Tax=Nocardioides sp. Bht2 TaxID=3392297 RepID=UPI0039B6893D